MFSIVFGHFACHGIFHDDNSVVQALAIATLYSVGAFAFISGWYGIRFSVERFVRFLALGLTWSIFLWLLTPCLLGEWRFEISLGWFGNAYLALMLIAPFINEGVDRMYECSPHALASLWIVYAMLIVASWLPLPLIGIHIIPSGWASHTVNTLMFFYLTGRIFRLDPRIQKVPYWFWVALFLLGDMAYVGWSVCGHFFRNNGTLFGWLLNSHVSYMNPFIICSSVAIFFVFLKLPSERFLSWANWLAPSMFSVYLLQEGCNRYSAAWLYSSLETAFLPWLGNGTISAIANIALSAVIAFLACVMIDVIRRICVAALRSLFRPKEDIAG